MASPAVKPAVPRIIASRGVSPSGMRTTQSAGTRTNCAVAAVLRHTEVVAGDEHAVAFAEAAIGARGDDASDVDATDERKALEDLAGARRGERVLVVDARVFRLDDDVARVSSSSVVSTMAALILPSVFVIRNALKLDIERCDC